MLWIIRTVINNKPGAWLLTEADDAAAAAVNLSDSWYSGRAVSHIEVVQVIDARERPASTEPPKERKKKDAGQNR